MQYKNIYEKLLHIQKNLHCPKDLAVMNYNGVKQYGYRNLAGIMEAVKPLLEETRCILTVTCMPTAIGAGEAVMVDETDSRGDVRGHHLERGMRIYQVATATLVDCDSGEKVVCTASARENEWRKGMDASQLSGSAESFASKYACEHLFALDSTEDADDLAAEESAFDKAQNAAKTATDAPQTTPQRKEIKAVKSDKAHVAWAAFKELPLSKSMTDAKRNEAWKNLLKEKVGKIETASITDADWDKVINEIDILAAL